MEYILNDPNGILSCGVGILLILIFIESIRPKGQYKDHENIETEQAYLIREKETQYPMVVAKRVMLRAMATGDYIYEGLADHRTAGNHYYNNSWIPGGDIPVERANYLDERLND